MNNDIVLEEPMKFMPGDLVKITMGSQKDHYAIVIGCSSNFIFPPDSDQCRARIGYQLFTEELGPLKDMYYSHEMMHMSSDNSKLLKQWLVNRQNINNNNNPSKEDYKEKEDEVEENEIEIDKETLEYLIKVDL